MNKNELITIIVPVYNVEKYLTKCVNSILEQTYKNLEIILVDDGSPDKCPQICDEYAKKDNRIKVIHKNNGGLSDARNKGLDMATGKYISFVDSDDYIDKKMIEKLYNNLLKNEADISICNIYKIYPNGTKIKKNLPQSEITVSDEEKYIYTYNKYGMITVTAWSKLYKKEIFTNIRYPLGKIHEDEYIIFDILKKANKISYFDEALYYYLQRTESIIGTFSLKRLDIITPHENKLLSLKDNPRLLKLEYIHYIHILTKDIIPGLNSIKEHERTNFYINRAKQLSTYALKSFNLNRKEKLKLTIIKIFPKSLIKLICSF